MIARLSAVNEVAELRTAADVLKGGDHFQRAAGRLLACIAEQWSTTNVRPIYTAKVLDLADVAIGGAR